MTITDLTKITQLSRNTILRKVKEFYPGIVKNGKTIDLDEQQAIKVMEDLRKKGFITPVKNGEVPSQNGEVDLKSAFIIMANAFDRLTNISENQEKRLQTIENKIEQRKALLPAPQIEPSQYVNKLVREYAEKHNMEFKETWDYLYNEFKYRTHTDPQTCAKNRNIRTIEYIKDHGMIETLEAIAIELFAGKIKKE